MEGRVLESVGSLLEAFEQAAVSRSPFSPNESIGLAVGNVINSLLFGYTFEVCLHIQSHPDTSKRFTTFHHCEAVEALPHSGVLWP